MSKQYTHTIRNTITGWTHTGPAQPRRHAASAAVQALIDNVVETPVTNGNELYSDLLNGPAPQTVIRAAGYEAWIEETK